MVPFNAFLIKKYIHISLQYMYNTMNANFSFIFFFLFKFNCFDLLLIKKNTVSTDGAVMDES